MQQSELVITHSRFLYHYAILIAVMPIFQTLKKKGTQLITHFIQLDKMKINSFLHITTNS